MKQIKSLCKCSKAHTTYIIDEIEEIIFDELSLDAEMQDVERYPKDCFSKEDKKELEHLILMITNRAKRRILERNTNK
jgi:hypothetical protein